MTKIYLNVVGTDIHAEVTGPLTEGMVGTQVKIRYDKSWDGLVKTLVCRSNVDNRAADTSRIIPNVGAESTVAHEVMIAGRTLYLGLEGRSGDGAKVIPTIWADCGRILPGANVDSQEVTMGATPEAWEQLMMQMGNLDGLHTDEKGSLVDAINEAMTKGNGAPGKNGRGILSTVSNDDGSWTFTYDDGTMENVSNEAYMEMALRMEQISKDIIGKKQLTPEFASSAEDCTDPSKLYVLPDGFIYAYMSSANAITIETTYGGYYDKNGAWVEADQATGQRTNLIPVTEGEQFEVTSFGKYQASVIWFTSAETKISHEAYYKEGSNYPPATVTVTTPAGAAYVRFYSYGYGATHLAVKPLQENFAWVSTGHAFVPADYEDRILLLEEKVDYQEEGANDPLHGKKIVYDGDSICYGHGYKGGYAKMIAELTGGSFDNQAVGGARLVTKGSNSWHSVVDNLPNLPTDGDLYCFEGGINDFWTSGMQLGTYNHTNYEGKLDTTTVCGALETIFRYALNNFAGKPVCFVIAHKIQDTAFSKNTAGNTFKEYHDAMVGICQKYSIPYYDAFNDSGLNGWNDVQNALFFADGDGCHPNEEAYKRYYVPQLLDLFRKMMSGGGYYQAIPAVVTSETWTFELADGSVVEKQVVAKW